MIETRTFLERSKVPIDQPEMLVGMGDIFEPLRTRAEKILSIEDGIGHRSLVDAEEESARQRYDQQTGPTEKKRDEIVQRARQRTIDELLGTPGRQEDDRRREKAPTIIDAKRRKQDRRKRGLLP